MKLTNKQKELIDKFNMTRVFYETSKSEKEKMYFQNKAKEIDKKLMTEEIKKYEKNK
jgi:hypothetical protein